MRLDVEIHKSLLQRDANFPSLIAAASIAAKVTRDRLMADYDKEFPGYDFARKNAGYGPKSHLMAWNASESDSPKDIWTS